MDTHGTVYIIDDDAQVLSSTTFLLESLNYCIKKFQSPSKFLSITHFDRPACILLDLRMPELSGLQLQNYMNERQIDLPVIFMSAHGDVITAATAMKNGAVDFLVKPPSPHQLIETVNHAISIDRNNLDRHAEREKLSKLIAKLTPRELDVMQYLIAGKTSKMIAKALNISPGTAESHRANVIRKMGNLALPELAALLMQHQLLIDSGAA
jgi:two-component system response regulator FixJ